MLCLLHIVSAWWWHGVVVTEIGSLKLVASESFVDHELLKLGSALLALDLVGHCSLKNYSFGATLARHAWDEGGEAIEARTDGLATLLLGEDVVLLLLMLGEASTVVVGCFDSSVVCSRAAGVDWAGRHGDDDDDRFDCDLCGGVSEDLLNPLTVHTCRDVFEK